jgi:alkanesulfonate monooxygenase SsuD/methylene tetrahydromethanopterin reductase-like flavin-dependent oxidoreductase (luciferase family)
VESVEWAARHQYPYMNLGSLHETTLEMKKVYRETAAEVGYTPGPEHFGYVVRALVADTDEKAQEIGRHYMWTHDHRMKGPREENDPPGYQSREAAALRARRRGLGSTEKMSYEELLAIDNIIAGSPETVTNKLGKLVEGLNPGFLFIYGNEGPMEHSDTMRSIELLGKEVIPALREIKLRPEE